MAKAPTDIRSLARSHTRTAIKTLAGIMQEKQAPHSARVRAAEALINRGWGMPKQEMTIEDKRQLSSLSDGELESIARGEPRSGNGAAESEGGPAESDSVH